MLKAHSSVTALLRITGIIPEGTTLRNVACMQHLLGKLVFLLSCHCISNLQKPLHTLSQWHFLLVWFWHYNKLFCLCFLTLVSWVKGQVLTGWLPKCDFSLTQGAVRWKSQYRPAPLLIAEPSRALIDEQISIQGRFLPPHWPVTVRAHMHSEEGDLWEAFSHYNTDKNGVINCKSKGLSLYWKSKRKNVNVY